MKLNLWDANFVSTCSTVWRWTVWLLVIGCIFDRLSDGEGKMHVSRHTYYFSLYDEHIYMYDHIVWSYICVGMNIRYGDTWQNCYTYVTENCRISVVLTTEGSKTLNLIIAREKWPVPCAGHVTRMWYLWIQRNEESINQSRLRMKEPNRPTQTEDKQTTHTTANLFSHNPSLFKIFTVIDLIISS